MIRRNKGITLIALIITIIIMLILVGTSISLVIRGNLIGVAQDAANRTETSYEEEATMGKITINGKEYDSIEEYINGPGPKLAYSVKGKKITISLADSYENYVAKKSKDAKEQAFAEANDCSNFGALIEAWYFESREAYEAWAMERWEVSTYEEALNLDCIYEECFAEEYSSAYEDLIEKVVTVTDPSGEEHELYYVPVGETSFTYTVAEEGNYKFTAVNEKGISSEITVPVELEMGTFTLLDPEGNKLGDFEFVIGETWEDFIGETGFRTIAQGYISRSTLYVLYFVDGVSHNLTDSAGIFLVRPYHEIVDSYSYYTVVEPL